MFFNSVNRLRKEIIRLLIKEMSNIYYCQKVTIKKNWRSQNFDFLRSKNCHQVSFWGASTHVDTIEFEHFLL